MAKPESTYIDDAVVDLIVDWTALQLCDNCRRQLAKFGLQLWKQAQGMSDQTPEPVTLCADDLAQIGTVAVRVATNQARRAPQAVAALFDYLLTLSGQNIKNWLGLLGGQRQ